jgi:ribosomal protein S18 acetylase RimI-like enzyme
VPDADALLRATAANHRAWFRRCAAARQGSVARIDGIELAVEPPWGTLAFPGVRARSAARVDEVMASAHGLGLDRMSCWSLGEDRVLGTLLIARGFEWGWQAHWMACGLARLPADDGRYDVVPFDPGAEGTELPYRTLIDPASTHHLSVRDGGVTVGQVTVNPWRGFAGIYNTGVAPSHRRRGIGRALTLAACRLGRRLGCTDALLNATEEGERLYRTVGFKSLGKGRTWWLHPGRRPTPRQTALVEAIGLGGVDAVAALRPRRAELARRIPGAGRPLEVTALTGQPAVADWILTRRPELASRPLSKDGYSLLHAAVEWDSEPLVRVALAHGADPTAREDRFGGTPRSWAAHFERPHLAALLS